STRLMPADLQTETGIPLPGCEEYSLPALDEAEALDLWVACGCRRPTTSDLNRILQSFGGHPLLICVLAGVVAEFRRAPGDFDAWHRANPTFDPSSLPLVQANSHVLAHALAGLKSRPLKVLQTVAAFRLPASYSTLAALLVGPKNVYASESE